MPQPIVYLNGEYLPLDQAQVSVMDRGFLLADGIYEVTPLYDGEPFYLKDHYARMSNSLKTIHMDPPVSLTDVEEIIQGLVKHNGAKAMGSIYMQVTRGASDARRGFEHNLTPTIFAFLQETDPRIIKEGAKTILIDEFRWGNCDIKGINRLANTLMYQRVLEAKVDEAIVIKDGFAIEAASSNVAIIKNNTLITPPLSKNLLPGITRKVLFKIAKTVDLPIVEALIPKAELFSADEVLLTASNKEITGVIEIDGTMIGNGQPGPWVRKLQNAYTAEVKAHCKA